MGLQFESKQRIVVNGSGLQRASRVRNLLKISPVWAWAVKRTMDNPSGVRNLERCRMKTQTEKT